VTGSSTLLDSPPEEIEATARQRARGIAYPESDTFDYRQAWPKLFECASFRTRRNHESTLSHPSPQRAWRLLAIFENCPLTLLVIELVARLVRFIRDSLRPTRNAAGDPPNAAGCWVNACVGQVRNWVQLNSHGLRCGAHHEKPPARGGFSSLAIAGGL
jgi:hypothetical protein